MWHSHTHHSTLTFIKKKKKTLLDIEHQTIERQKGKTRGGGLNCECWGWVFIWCFPPVHALCEKLACRENLCVSCQQWGLAPGAGRGKQEAKGHLMGQTVLEFSLFLRRPDNPCGWIAQHGPLTPLPSFPFTPSYRDHLLFYSTSENHSNP